jgi:hypothetical protein
MKRLIARVGAVAAIAFWSLLAFPGLALAEVDGPCTASVGGVDVTDGRDTPGSAIEVQVDEALEISGTAEGAVQDLVYTVRIAGGGVNVGNVAIRGEDGRIWEGSVDLAEFSWAGVGLFEVTADVQTAAGPCEARVFICIEGRNPLTTAAGGGSAAVGAGGIALLGLSLARSRRLGAARSVIQGFAGGATTALGAGVLLQQFCAVPLTLVTAAVVPAGVGVMGSVGSYGLRRAGRSGARRAVERLRPRVGQAPGAPAAEPTEVLDRGARELERAGERAAERGREVAESLRAQGGPSPAGPGGGGAGGGPAPAPPGGGAPGGPAPAPPGGGGAPGGPAPAPPGGGGAPGGPAPAPPGGGAPGGPAPAPPGGGAPGGPAPAPPGGGAPGGPAPAPPGGGAPGGPAPTSAPGTPPPPPPAQAGAVVPPVVPAARDEERICPNCSSVNSGESQFCTNCGTRLEA